MEKKKGLGCGGCLGIGCGGFLLVVGIVTFIVFRLMSPFADPAKALSTDEAASLVCGMVLNPDYSVEEKSNLIPALIEEVKKKDYSVTVSDIAQQKLVITKNNDATYKLDVNGWSWKYKQDSNGIMTFSGSFEITLTKDGKTTKFTNKSIEDSIVPLIRRLESIVEKSK